MNYKLCKTKLPLFTLAAELLICIVVSVLFALSLKNMDFATPSLLEKATENDSITGWLIAPSMMLDMVSLLVYIVIVAGPVVFFFSCIFSLGWNIAFNHMNKDHKVWLEVVAVLPACLSACYMIYLCIVLVVGNLIPVLLFMIPALLLLAHSVIQVRVFMKEFHQEAA
ncbi:hypothetical protein [Anaerosporobacter faecicola]|uniref:hypothetical protein n=1 Tax=Anaerosporobacter faecicola TaxID=2718714 RepID=UPI00143B09EB|nr:hypothetical protein [Anaerosporobacter faecicola]